MAEVNVTLVAGVVTESGRLGFPVGVILPTATIYEMGGATTSPYVYVVDSGNNRINAYDYGGNFKFSFGSAGTGDGEFVNPYKAATDGTYVYVTDRGNHRVQIFTMFGVYVGQIGTYGTGDGQFDTPMGIAVDDYYLWVVDHGNNRFQIFSLNAYEFVYELGEYGSGENQFDGPTDCEVDDLFFYITDLGNLRIVIYPKNIQIGFSGDIAVPATTIAGTFDCRSFQGSIESPLPEIAGTFLGGGIFSGDITSPKITIAGRFTTGGVFTGTISVPVSTISGEYKLALAHFSGTIASPLPTINGEFLAGGIFTGTIYAPVSDIAGTFHEVGVFSGNIVAPIAEITGYFRANVVTGTFNGVVVNLKTKGIMEYSDFNFNSFLYIDGVLHGANSTGLYPLTGDDDNGTAIAATIETGSVDLHDGVVKRIVDAYVEGRIPDNMVLSIREEEENDVTDYDLEGESTGMKDYRIKFAKGHKGREVAVALSNVDGGDFDIKTLRVKAESKPKRLR